MTYEIWICRQGTYDDWHLAERKRECFAESCARKWFDRGWKVAIYGPDGLRFYKGW